MAAPAVDPSAEPAAEPGPDPGRRRGGRLRRLLTSREPGPGTGPTWLCLRLAASAGGGVLLYFSFPPYSTWWLALPAFALLGPVLWGRGARGGFGYGFLFGVGFLLPLLQWTSIYVGPVPWIALTVAESCFIGLAAAAMAVVSRLPGGPLWTAAAWVAGEALRGRVPFGGLPWGRVGFGQPDGPLLPIAAIGGEPLLSYAAVLAGLAAGELVRRLVVHRSAVVGNPAMPALAVAAALAAGPLAGLVPPTAGTPQRSVTVAAIQGNVPRLGLDFNAQRRAVLDNHVKVTRQLADEVAAGSRPQPDIVIWPENSSDINPIRNPDAAAAIDGAARAIGAPILVGTVLTNPDATTTNSSLVWEAGTGPVARNDKRRVQPFGEYIPWRGFFRLFSSYVDRGGNFVDGTGSGAVDMAGVRVGDVICWEVAFDDLVADSIDAGATLLAVPSNNATFGLSNMTYQQLAMSRVRAVEHDRPVVVATTSGVSAMIAPDGTVTQRTGQFEPGILVDQPTMKDTTTLATRWRSAPEWVLVALSVVAVGIGVVARRRGGRHSRRGRKDEHG
ncbi:apolipoprotein N-acyltransferase [Pseudonocardia lacus]|uniref:apolipoprotein N-acyltransferase n=1 Tax=Pseudonocardia lacus TaxID=2835865 RepID=UPI0027E32493|nr:apolipoprotein N-acyltransferase [Pseudonocardia lacus]